MANGISWPKDCRAYAAEHNRDLFAFGMDGKGGKLTAHCNMPRGEAAKLSLFCVKITRGMPPGMVFHEVYAEINQADRAESPSEEWLESMGFKPDGDVWCLCEETHPLFIKRSDTEPDVWSAEIDGTPWPLAIQYRGQIFDLCTALEIELVPKAT